MGQRARAKSTRAELRQIYIVAATKSDVTPAGRLAIVQEGYQTGLLRMKDATRLLERPVKG